MFIDSQSLSVKQDPEVTPLTSAKKDKKVQVEDIDIEANKHVGQIALRKLYHESPRPIVVLYTAKSCGPCRTLKPIVNAVADEFGEKVKSQVAFVMLCSLHAPTSHQKIMNRIWVLWFGAFKMIILIQFPNSHASHGLK